LEGFNVVVDIDSIRGFVVVEEGGDAMNRKLGLLGGKSPRLMDFDVGVVIQMNADRIGETVYALVYVGRRNNRLKFGFLRWRRSIAGPRWMMVQRVQGLGGPSSLKGGAAVSALHVQRH
jgi:hypothetical protein